MTRYKSPISPDRADYGHDEIGYAEFTTAWLAWEEYRIARKKLKVIEGGKR